MIYDENTEQCPKILWTPPRGDLWLETQGNILFIPAAMMFDKNGFVVEVIDFVNDKFKPFIFS